MKGDRSGNLDISGCNKTPEKRPGSFYYVKISENLVKISMERFGLDGDFLELKRRVARLLESYVARINPYQRATSLCK